MNGAEISDADFAEAFTRVHAAIEELLARGELAAHPTFFECVTAMAFEYFARAERGFCGLRSGHGRPAGLDEHVITPEVAVITQIDFDHENFLGHSIEEIAGEKAGIIKPGSVGGERGGKCSRAKGDRAARRRTGCAISRNGQRLVAWLNFVPRTDATDLLQQERRQVDGEQRAKSKSRCRSRDASRCATRSLLSRRRGCSRSAA